MCVCVRNGSLLSSVRDNVDILKSVQKLQRFSVPQFMEKKMKDFVRNVQGERERERG